MIREKNYINALPSEWILKSKHIYINQALGLSETSSTI